jgi:NitT/TauT family transport system substrate-binding protein
MFAAYGRAIAKATLFTLTNPEAAIRLLWRHVAETRPAPGTEPQALARDRAVLQARLDNLGIGDGADARWGAIAEAEIAAWQDFMLGTGAIRRRRPPRDYFDDSLVDAFNAFDPAPIVTAARSFALG